MEEEEESSSEEEDAPGLSMMDDDELLLLLLCDDDVDILVLAVSVGMTYVLRRTGAVTNVAVMKQRLSF